MEKDQERRVEVITDLDGNRIVVIHDIRFRGRQRIDWDEVERYLKRFVGEDFVVEEYSQKIYIGADLPNEFAGSTDTARLKGTLAKAKANSAQGVPEMIQIADNMAYQDNLKKKHEYDAKNGWYRYDTRFALPVYGNDKKVNRYNVFLVRMIVRYSADGKRYLYDMINIRKEKETGTPHEPKTRR